MRKRFAIKERNLRGCHLALCHDGNKGMKFCFYYELDDVMLFRTANEARRFFEKNVKREYGFSYYIVEYRYNSYTKKYEDNSIYHY